MYLDAHCWNVAKLTELIILCKQLFDFKLMIDDKHATHGDVRIINRAMVVKLTLVLLNNV